MKPFGNLWDEILKDEFNEAYYLKLREFLKSEYSQKRIFPDMYDIYNAFRYTDYNDVKVVILGQDPYHGEGEAHGLSFSVKPGIAIPPSLRNMYKELHDSLGCYIPNNGYLEKWARQGVLLLNTSLTVVKDSPNSHKNVGWEIFTDAVISALNEKNEPILFILWGANAKAKAALITNPIHLKLTAAHPSPLSAYNGFFGCKHFSKTNEFLIKNGREPIDWSLK